MALARVSPSFRVKNGLYRMMRCRVGERVAVGLEATFDVLYPELIDIGDDVTVGYSTTILCHEYIHGEYRTGPVVLGARATIGANCTILPGVTVGADAIVSAMSLVNRDVPAGEFWGGVPARRLRPRDTDSVSRGPPSSR